MSNRLAYIFFRRVEQVFKRGHAKIGQSSRSIERHASGIVELHRNKYGTVATINWTAR